MRGRGWSWVAVVGCLPLLCSGLAVAPALAARQVAVVAIATGGLVPDVSTCAATTDGGVKCWGNNLHGQLGDGTTKVRPSPVDVIGLAGDVVDVSTDGDSMCALNSAGGVQCWGMLALGERHHAVSMPGLATGISAITGGGGMGCALTTGGSLKCWGDNSFGQVGDGTTKFRSAPVAVAGLSSGVTSVSAGGDSTCAVTASGAVWCWGWNRNGELGDGTTRDRHRPVPVVGLTNGATLVAVGAWHACAVVSAGGLKCWGDNYGGALGDGTTRERHTPVDVVGLTTGVANVTAGSSMTCAVTDSGGAKCWGANDTSQLGHGSFSNESTPVDVVGMTSGVTAMSAADYDACAVTTNGAARCWGENSGAVGDGTMTMRPIPMTVWGIAGIPAEPVRPDVLIARQRSGPYRGNNIYNLRGTGQIRTLRLHRGQPARLYVQVQNDGTVHDFVYLVQPFKPGLRIGTRYAEGGANVTPFVQYGDFWTALRIGGHKTFRVTVQPKANAVIDHQYSFRVLTTSSHNPATRDAVKITVTVVG